MITVLIMPLLITIRTSRSDQLDKEERQTCHMPIDKDQILPALPAWILRFVHEKKNLRERQEYEKAHLILDSKRSVGRKKSSRPAKCQLIRTRILFPLPIWILHFIHKKKNLHELQGHEEGAPNTWFGVGRCTADEKCQTNATFYIIICVRPASLRNSSSR